NHAMRWLAAFILLSFVDVGVTVLLTKYLGALLTYGLFVGLTFAGLLIQWMRRDSMKSAWRRTQASLESAKNEKRSNDAWLDPVVIDAFVEVEAYWFSTFLLIIPGPLTAGLAFLLMSPIGRWAVIRHFRKYNTTQ